MGWFRRTSATDGGGEPSYEDRLAQVGPGVPGHCPACDGIGYIDSIDIGHRYQIQHCKDCLHRWEYLFDGDGHVVGLTELDGAGQPVARSRVRPAPTSSVEGEQPAVEPRAAVPMEATVPVEAVPVEAALPVEEPADHVLDLRDDAEAPPVLDLTDPTELSPAAWLRQSMGR